MQTRYHRYLLETVPGVFAARMRTAVQRTQRKAKPEPVIPPIEHRGRKLVPMGYLAGVALVLGGFPVGDRLRIDGRRPGAAHAVGRILLEQAGLLARGGQVKRRAIISGRISFAAVFPSSHS